MLKILISLTLLASLTGISHAIELNGADETVLFRARINNLKPAIDRNDAVDNPGVINFGTKTSATISIEDVLIGTLPKQDREIEMTMSGTPLAEELLHIIVLGI